MGPGPAAPRPLQRSDLALVAALAERLGEALLVLEAGGTLLYLSPAAERLFGCASADVVGGNLAMFMPPPRGERRSPATSEPRWLGLQGVRNGGCNVLGAARDGRTVRLHIRLAETVIRKRPLLLLVVREAAAARPADDQARDRDPLFDALLEQAFQMVAILTPAGRIVRVNRGGLDLVGMRHEDAVGRSFASAPWWGPVTESRRRARDAIRRAAAGETVCFEAELRGPGPAATLELAVRPVISRSGVATRLVVEGRDITEARRSAAALRRSDAQLRRAQRVARLHHWQWTAQRAGKDWRCTPSIYSPGAEEIFGVSAEQLAAADTNFGERFIHPDDRDRICRATRQILDGEIHDYAFEYRVVRPDGGQRIVHELAEVETAEDGRLKTVAGTIQDITDLRRAEAALRRSEQSLANAQRIARIGSWRWDAATDSVAWSREVFRILGFDPDATTPTFELFLSRVHPEDRDGLVKVIEASLRHATSCSIDYRLVLPDGSIRHVHEQAEVLCDAEGHVVCRNGTIQDVTPRKQEEEALRRAKRAAEAAVQAKSRFLANMSHELRTPLNAIIGFSEVMANEMLGPLGAAKYAVYARDILDSGRRLLSVINDILEMSRIETGAVQLRESRIEFDAIAAAALQLIERRAADVGLTLVKDVPPDMPPVLADERLIRQAAINLLSNAVKFTPAGGRVALRAGLASDGGAWLAVADTGIGIAPESIATALEPFGQVDSSLSRRYEGTGLGLPLVSSIVELHQGSMAIDSAVGAGTTVTMKLPPSRTIGINTRCAPENSTAPSATRNR